MNEKKLQSLSKYSKVASWAIWNNNEIQDTSIIEKKSDLLHNEVVIVGLNVSDDIENKWSNFHNGNHDRKLMKLFNNSSYQGAYMTDIIKNHVAVKSQSLNDLDQSVIDKNIETFKDEMSILGANNSTLFILFGQKTQELFIDELVFYFNNIVTCTHYSYYGKGYTDEKWIEETSSKLKKHYQKTKEVCNTKKFLFL